MTEIREEIRKEIYHVLDNLPGAYDNTRGDHEDLAITWTGRAVDAIENLIKDRYVPRIDGKDIMLTFFLCRAIGSFPVGGLQLADHISFKLGTTYITRKEAADLAVKHLKMIFPAHTEYPNIEKNLRHAFLTDKEKEPSND